VRAQALDEGMKHEGLVHGALPGSET